MANDDKPPLMPDDPKLVECRVEQLILSVQRMKCDLSRMEGFEFEAYLAGLLQTALMDRNDK